MTDYQLARRAIEIFSTYEVPHDTRRRYQRQWLRSVRTLGDKWLYAQFINKLTPQQQRARSEDGTYRIKTGTSNAAPRS